jgi:hypothetical protein
MGLKETRPLIFNDNFTLSLSHRLFTLCLDDLRTNCTLKPSLRSAYFMHNPEDEKEPDVQYAILDYLTLKGTFH